MDIEIIINRIIIFAVFGLALSLWCIGVFLWLGRYLVKLKAIQRRLGISPEFSKDSEVLRLWRDVQIKLETEQFDLDHKPGIRERIDQWIEDAGFNAPLRTIVLGVFCLVFLAFIVGYGLTKNPWVGICAAFAAFYIFLQYTQSLIMKRANLFERQLVDALGVAARALRAGHPLVGAFQLIAEEIGDPLGKIFGQIYQQQAFGSDLRESIRNAAKVNRNTEFKLFATAISVQLQSGGNLADLVDSLASVVRSRMRLNKRIRVLTAQTQFSKAILIAMPFIMFILLNIMNREYMNPLYTTPQGRMMLLVAFVNILLGSWMMNKMIKINF
ncbi:MAG: type II secretion system F family protein [Phycisphaerae bacterium]|nr:type II secretion system F family protein [Phycisphaerae bacterium]